MTVYLFWYNDGMDAFVMAAFDSLEKAQSHIKGQYRPDRKRPFSWRKNANGTFSCENYDIEPMVVQ